MNFVIADTIEKALDHSYNYESYRALVALMVSENRTSGADQSETMLEYTRLNDRRMRRWDKTFKLTEDQINLIQKFDQKVSWLVLTEAWCGDAAHSIPIMNKIAEVNQNINLRLVFRDEHLELMDQYLINGTRSIPKLIMIDDLNGEVLGEWGSRPKSATTLVENYKKEHGKLTPEFKQELQLWYNKNKGQDILEDLLGLLSLK